MNYIIANIRDTGIVRKKLYKRGLFVTVFPIADSKATPKGYFDSSDEVLDSYIISIVPDGDYYTSSKLFKIEGLCKPEILELIETKYPEIQIKIESGFMNNRVTKIYKINGN